jgi:hypothetical protein
MGFAKKYDIIVLLNVRDLHKTTMLIGNIEEIWDESDHSACEVEIINITLLETAFAVIFFD